MERTRRRVPGLYKGTRKSHTPYSKRHSSPCMHKIFGPTFQSAVLCACFLPKVPRVHIDGHKGATQTQAWAQCDKRRWERIVRALMLPSGQSLGISRLRGQQDPTFCASLFNVAIRQTGSCICFRAACHLAALHSFSHVKRCLVFQHAFSQRFVLKVRFRQKFCFTTPLQVLCKVHTLHKSDCLKSDAVQSVMHYAYLVCCAIAFLQRSSCIYR